jgi:hypothetical protein
VVQYSEHTHYHLKKEKSDFPHIQGLTMQILVQMRGLLCGQRRIWRVRADRIEEKSACVPDARLWAEKPARLCQKSEKKNPDGFLSNFW